MATTTVMRTPDRDSRTTFLRRPMTVADPAASNAAQDFIGRSSPSPTPLRRRTDGDRDFQSPVRPVERIALSFGNRPSLQRTSTSTSDPSSTTPAQARRPLEQSQTRLPRVSNSSLPISDPPARTPSTRPAQLSLQDLNAPKAKRRSIEFAQSPLPRLVLTPPDAKSKARVSHGRLPAPVFTNTKPLLRRASSSPPSTPSAHNEDWLANLSKYSDSMTKLSLHESDEPDHDSSPFGDSLRVPLDRSLRLAKAPTASHVRHRRARSGEVKSIKRLSLGRVPDDVFDATSSSSPFGAVTPLQDSFKVVRDPQPLVWQPDAGTPFTQQELNIDGVDPVKPRSESLPDFFMPFQRGIAQKRSNIGNTSIGSRAKGIKPKASRLSDREKLQPRDSSVAGFSFEGEHDDVGDSSFTSMTSLGSPVDKPSAGFPTNFLAGLDDPVDNNPPFTVLDVPMVTPGFGPSTNSGWPGAADAGLAAPLDSDGEENGDIDMDSILFTSMQAKQAGRSSLPGPSGKPMMPDTPVKHPGRLGLSVQRAWQSTTKLIQTHKAKPPRKSLPLKFSPFPNQSKSMFDSPDSDCSEFSPNPSNPSPSPSLRNHASMAAPRKSYGLNAPIGLGRPTSTQTRIPTSSSSPTITQPGGLFGAMSMIPKSVSVKTDLLNNMGIDKKRADLLRRTSSSAWSFSSESGSEGASTPSRGNMRLEDWRFPSPSLDNGHTGKLIHRKSVTFIDSSPLTRRSSAVGFGRLPSPARDTAMSSANSSPSRSFPSPFHRPLSPLPTSPYWNDSDDDDCEEDVVLDFGIREEPRRFESQFVCEEGLGAGSFGQAFRVMLKQNSSSGTNKTGVKSRPKFYAIKKSKRYEGARHRLRLLEEFDILRHLAGDTTSRRSRSMSLSYPASAPVEAPNVNVLQFVHGWEQDSMLCIQTELCELGNLSDFLFEFGAKFSRLDEPRIWKIMSEVGNGLLHIHHQNVIHLDLKPANIFITLEGRLRIGDFGMASRWPRPASFGDGSEGFDREGDREYMAPEILKGKYGREADIFSFGMIMLECAGNIVVPDMGDPWHRLRSQDFSDIDLSGLTPTLIDLIMRLMSPDPAGRPLIDQVCAHDVVMKTRSTMLRNIEAVRRASITLIANAAPAEVEAAREEAQIALFKASALGTEDETFLSEVFSESAEERHLESEPMDLTP